MALTRGDAYEGGRKNTSSARNLMKKDVQPNKFNERTHPTQKVNEQTRMHFRRKVPGRLEATINKNTKQIIKKNNTNDIQVKTKFLEPRV